MKRFLFIILSLLSCCSIYAIKTATEIKSHLDSVAAQDPEGKNTLAYCENLDRAIDDLLGIGEGREATNLVFSFLDSWKTRWSMLGNTYGSFSMRQADILLQRGMIDSADKYITFVLDKLSESCDSIVRYRSLVIAAEINVANGNIKKAEAQLDKAEREFLKTNSTKQLYRIYGARYEIANKYGDMEAAETAAKKQMTMAATAYGKDSQKYISAMLRAYEAYVFASEDEDPDLEEEFLRVLPIFLEPQHEVETASVALFYQNKLTYLRLYSTMIMCKGVMQESDRQEIGNNLNRAIATLFEINKIFTSPVRLTGFAQKVIGELAASIDKYSIANQGMEYAYRMEKALQGEATLETALDYALTLMYTGDIEKSTSLFKTTIASATKQTLQNFRRMTASERANYWNQSYSLYQRVLTAAIEAKANGEFPEIGYDILLLSKGLLLNSEVECRHLIESSNNSEVIALYNKWAQQRAALDYVMQTNAGNTDSTSVKKMAQEIDQLEQQLMQKSADFGDFTSGFNITHTEVQQALKPGDVAVEFAAVNPPDMLSEDIYCAYILTSTGKAQLKILGTLDDLYSLAPSSKQAFTADVYNEVWAPILSDLSNVKRVYFAPAGILNNLSIENVDGCKKYEFYRLSSTRELAAANQTNQLKEAIVYGGLTYNTDASTLEKDSKKYPNVKRTAHLSMRESEGGFDELSGTKVEAELIDKTLMQHNVDVQLFTDAAGTETSFKAISNSKHNLVHLATHGFYYTAEQAAEIDLSFMQATSQRDFSEDDMLKRSGLAFSGANNIVNGVKLPENVDDGILTAYEIARLNLKDLNLVVLSACQTGLGDVTSDGVFGLQRGFKKAGAQSLLMSLWKVDDQATQMLMSQFYTNLTQGKSKRQSLLNAQRYVREYSDASATNEATRHPYSDPQYWAAFILLDATD